MSFIDKTQISIDKLRMKQSVRTTFKLSQEAISLLGMTAAQLGIKQKSLLDQLIEDNILLGELAKQLEPDSNIEENRLPKTYVLSKSTLQRINDLSKKNKIPRDLLVEVSVQRLLPVVEIEKEKHSQRKKILREMKKICQLEESLHNSAKQSLGKDDELSEILDKQVSLMKKNVMAVETIVQKGQQIEEASTE